MAKRRGHKVAAKAHVKKVSHRKGHRKGHSKKSVLKA
jgi:hypothetical protein